MVRHVAKHPVRIAESSIINSLSQRVTRILAIRSPNTLRAVNHGEDAARLEQDGVRRTRRRQDMNAGGTVRAREGVDLRVDAVRARLLGRGRGLVCGIRGFGGIGRISTVRGCTILRGVGGGNAGVGARRIEVGRLHVAMHVLAICRSGGSGGSEGGDKNS